MKVDVYKIDEGARFPVHRQIFPRSGQEVGVAIQQVAAHNAGAIVVTEAKRGGWREVAAREVIGQGREN